MCGIFGMFGNKNASKLSYLGLYALQHRGEESAGIASSNGSKITYHKGMGLLNDVFSEKIINSLKGNMAVGHVRYSTTGSSHHKNMQPFIVYHKKGHIAIAHNGNLTNAFELRDILEERGAIFQTTMDSEVIAHLLTRSAEPRRENVIDALSKLKGAFSLVMIFNDTMIGARDTYGLRPLCLGKLDGSYVIASESCAFDLIQAEFIRDIEPGEILFINKNKIESVKPFEKTRQASCIFEHIYFSRPDSLVFGANVYLTRKELGRQLAREYNVKCDLVMPIPDSGNCAAFGYSEESNIPYEGGMIRNHYVGRTFIQPEQGVRDFRVRVKLNPVRPVLKGKRVMVIEDSIVRGTTCRARVKTLRESGAKEVHMGVSCPPIISPCFYGIDFPTKKELIAAKRTVEEIRQYIGLDSLHYLSLDGMLKSICLPKDNFCTACFSKNYPVKLPKRASKYILEKNR
ncbi:MAG: amidophosphoribosyltransferase [Candidatus Omnitrophica bacterium]|nr:amidophosphoribosyltransferase [Candidatus Omnitrophota bacterium]